MKTTRAYCSKDGRLSEWQHRPETTLKELVEEANAKATRIWVGTSASSVEPFIPTSNLGGPSLHRGRGIKPLPTKKPDRELNIQASRVPVPVIGV